MTLFAMCQRCLNITNETKFYIWTYSGLNIGTFTRTKIPEEYLHVKIHEYSSLHNESDNVIQVIVILQEE